MNIKDSYLHGADGKGVVKWLYLASSAETVYKPSDGTTYTTASGKDLIFLLADISGTKFGITLPQAPAYSQGVLTRSRSTNASHYLVFVDSNNSSATNELLYTDAEIVYNPSTNLLSVPKLIVSSTGGFNYSGIAAATENAAVCIWFSDSTNAGIPVTSNNFKYNPSTDTLTVGNIAGQYIKIGNKQVALKGTYTPDTSITSSSTHNTIPSSKAVWDLITNIDAFVYKGILNGGSSTTYTPAANCGYVYKVATAGLINGIYCEVGDLFICNADSTAAATSSNVGTISAKWDIIQANATMADYLLRAGGTMLGQLKWNDTNALPEDTTPSYLVTVSGIPASGSAAITKYTSVAKFKLNIVSNFVVGTQTAATNLWTGALPSGVTAYYDGLSIDYYLPYAGTGTAATLQLGNLGAVQVYNGRGPGNTTTHIPANSIVRMTYYNGKWYINSYYNSDTTNTTGGDDTSSKLFIVGMTSQTTSNGYQRTYTHDTCYIGTDGCLYSGGAKVLTALPSNAITGSGTNGYITRWTGEHTIGNLVALSAAVSSLTQSTKFLREDGTWAVPSYTTNTNTWRNVRINAETSDRLGTGTNTGPLIIKSGTGISVTWDATNKAVVITNSAPDVNHNTDRTGIKLGTVSGTKKTDGTVIINNSATGLNIAGGTNKFSIGDGTNYIEVPVTPSFTVSNKAATIGTSLTTIATINGTDITAKIASYVPFETSSTLASINDYNHTPIFYVLSGTEMISGYGKYWYVINMGKHTGGNHGAQIALNYSNESSNINSEMFIRKANNDTWEDWVRVLHSKNWSSYITWDTLPGKPNTFTPSPHSHNYIDSLGDVAPETGRTHTRGGVYTYRPYSNSAGGPSTYGAVIGFGWGTRGSGEIWTDWCGGGIWYRTLRDCCEDWYPWRRIADASNISNKDATIGTSSTTIATIAGINITAKIGSYAASDHTHKVKINGTEKTIAAPGGAAVDLGNYVPKIAGTGSVVAHQTSVKDWKGCKILIPGGSNTWMIAFTVRVYINYQYTDIVFSGYHYGSQHWFTPKARVIGGTINYKVVMGYEGDSANSLYVWIGNTSGSVLGYGGITVMNLHAGHNDNPDWYTTWTISDVAYADLTNKLYDTTTILPAMSDHTHSLSIAADSGTNQLTLAASTKYKLTAGGSTYVFTTPPNTWIANAVGVAGYVAAPTAADNKHNVWMTDGDGKPAWRAVTVPATVPTIGTSDTTLATIAGIPIKAKITNYNTDRTGVKLGTVSGTAKTDSTVIIANSTTGLTIQGGTNAFKIGDGTNYISVGVAHGLSTKNMTINGTAYALYTSASSLPTFVAPGSYGTANYILATNSSGNGLTWVVKPTSNVTTTAIVGNSATATSQITAVQTNPYYNLLEGGSVTRSIRFVAGTGITISAATDGLITITNSQPDVNHNTHFITSLYIGENNDTKANTAVGNPYLKLFDDNTRRSTLRFIAGNGITVASDANGNITITNSKPDVNHNTNTWRPIKVGGSEKLGSGIDTGAVDFVAGAGIQLAWDATNKKITIINSAPDVNHNTDTTVIDANHHYTPTANTDSLLTATPSGATAAWSIDVVTGVQIQRDAKGHVTGLTVNSGKIPGNPNSNTWRNIYVAGTLKMTTAISSKALNFKAGSNVTLSYLAPGTTGGTTDSGSADYGTLTITANLPSNNVTGSGTNGYITKWTGTNTIGNLVAIGSGTTKFLREDGTWATPAYIANTDRTGIKLVTSTPGSTLKTDSTVIIANSATGLQIKGGTNLFQIGDGTNYINVPISHGLSTKNMTINGTAYAIYTSASSLPTFVAPTSLASTGGYILATNSDKTGLEWVAKPVNSNTWRNIYTGGTSRVGTGTSTKAMNFTATGNLSISYLAAGTDSGQSGSADYFTIRVNAAANAKATAGYVAAPTANTNYNVWMTDNALDPAWRTVTASNPTLAWGTTSTIGTIGGVTFQVTMPSNPNSNTWRNIYVNGTLQMTTSNGSKALNFVAGTGITLTYAAPGTGSGLSGSADYGKLTIVNSLVTKNMTINGTAYAIYTSASSLPTFIAPTSLGSANQILATNSSANGLTWVNKPTSNVTTTAVVGSSATATSQITAAQSNPYYNLLEGGAVTRSIRFVAGTGITVASDTSGNITITNSSTNTDVNVKVNNTNPTSGTWYYPTWYTATSGTGLLNANDGFRYYALLGTRGALGHSILQIGNDTGSGIAGNKRGAIRIYGSDSTYTGILSNPNGNRDVYLPYYAGDMYLVHTGSATATVGGSTTPVYVAANGRLTAGSAYYSTTQANGRFHPLNGKITRAGGSYSWYNILQYNSSNANPSYYTADCAIINITSYTGWLPWIRAVDSEKGSWAIGQHTNALYIGRIPKSNTSNGLTYLWTFGATGDLTMTGSCHAAHFYENSDIRLKKIIKGSEYSVYDYAKIPIINFYWLNKIKNLDLHIGSIAQSVEGIIPEVVISDEYKSIDYGVLGTIASITACKKLVEHDIEIYNLKEEIKMLKNKIKEMEELYG